MQIYDMDEFRDRCYKEIVKYHNNTYGETDGYITKDLVYTKHCSGIAGYYAGLFSTACGNQVCYEIIYTFNEDSLCFRPYKQLDEICIS